MARKNIVGTSYLGLNLDKKDEKKLKEYLKSEEVSAKKLIRRLLKEFLKTV